MIRTWRACASNHARANRDLVVTFKIRNSHPEDADAVERVLRGSYPQLMAPAYDADLLQRALPFLIKANPHLLASTSYYIAEAGSEPVGCGGWSLEKPGTTVHEFGVGHIRHFATSAAWVGRGVGKAIYERCELDARAAGVFRLDCHSSRNGEPFYLALGFTRIGDMLLPLAADLMFPGVLMSRHI